MIRQTKLVYPVTHRVILQHAERILAQTKLILDSIAADFAAARSSLLLDKQSRVFVCQ